MNTQRSKWMGFGLGFALAASAGLFVGWNLTGSAPEAHAADARDKAPVVRGPGASFADVVDAVAPAVVGVHSEKFVQMQHPDVPFGDDLFRRFFGQSEPERAPQPRRQPNKEYRFSQRGMGSGIIIDAEGHILTNNHVVDGVDEVNITLPDKRTFDVEVIGTDPQTDLAVLKIKGKVPKDLPVARLGDSDKGRVGDWVLAFGAPFGYEQTVTAGIISAKGRGNVGVADYEDFIQTDAAINPGNSGGPLVNMDGEVIGINTAIATRVGQYAGVGFSIPINMIKNIMPTLLKGQTVKRGLLGVVIQQVDPEMAKQFGVDASKGALVAQVNEDSAADKAGVKVGDIILRFNGKEIDDVNHLRNVVAATPPGSKIEMVVLRDGKEKKLTATVGELTTAETAAAKGEPAKDVAELGLSVEPLTDDKAKQLGYEGDQGVLVASVEDDGAAAAAGIQPGDLIVEVNRTAVNSVGAFRDAVTKAKDKESLLMLVKRQESSRFVILKLPKGN
jgi:serine protease Do